jgi:hypothetical protein
VKSRGQSAIYTFFDKSANALPESEEKKKAFDEYFGIVQQLSSLTL